MATIVYAGDTAFLPDGTSRPINEDEAKMLGDPPPVSCCHLECSSPATWLIKSKRPYNDTYACDEHVEELTADDEQSLPLDEVAT